MNVDAVILNAIIQIIHGGYWLKTIAVGLLSKIPNPVYGAFLKLTFQALNQKRQG